MHPSLSQGSSEADSREQSLVKAEQTENLCAEYKPSAYSPDEGLWYPDGTIIVVAEGVGFCIYKGLLAEASDVFSNMFSNATPTPQPSPARESASPPDRCPVVAVSDTAAELRSILKVLLHGRR